MTLASNLGFPRIGHRRELKIALEKFWTGETNEAALQATAAALRTRHWKLQSGLGISHVPSGETAGAELWARDKRLHGVAVQLGLAITLPQRREA
jgi:hypothetical protein